jgi:threonine/homoserine/homoserine lactone efflux protein
MDWPTILSFSTFAFVAAFTPGPNNIMLAASGANFGFRASLAHIAGICVGFCLLVVGAGFGLSGLFAAFPGLYEILKGLSLLFLLYLAWKIGSAGKTETQHRDRPLRFWQAAAFQLVNPKGISVIISAVTAYTSSAAAVFEEVLILLIVFALVTVGSTVTWTAFGVFIRNLLHQGSRLRLFNMTMAALLLTSLIPIIAD